MSDYFEGAINDQQYKMMFDARWRMIYPAPFFDPIAIQTMMDPKIMIQWSRFFYDWHPIVNAAINKMVMYPITDFVYDTKDDKLRKNYEMLFETMNIRNLIIKMGLDYFVSGNAFLSFVMPFKRMLECPKCGYQGSVETTETKASFSKLSIKCNKCQETGTPKVVDTQVSDVNGIRSLLMNPMNMKLVYDELMDMTEYYYAFPNDIKSGILRGDKKYIANYPEYMLTAVYKKKMLKIFPDKLIHLKRPVHSASLYKGWGQPLVAPSLKYLFHLLVLLRAQDALSIDQILPWTILSPAASGSTDPVGDMDLGTWKKEVTEEWDKWKKNPLHKSIFPIPINSQIIGAQGKALMLTPEMQEVTNQILAGMHVPNEFVYGGLSWSGASVSLRMLENQFINYRTMMQRTIDWVVEQVSVYFGYPPIRIYMQDFKMADDVAQKQIYISLSDAGTISRQSLLSNLCPELDYSAEQEKVLEEKLAQLKMQATIQRQGMQATPMILPGGGTDTEGNAGDLPESQAPRTSADKKQI